MSECMTQEDAERMDASQAVQILKPLRDMIREIVRCKDCVNAQYRELGMVYCPRMIGSWVEDDWFCADGKRKEKSDG